MNGFEQAIMVVGTNFKIIGSFEIFKAKRSKEWSDMHYGFTKDPQQWLKEYHNRSISETVNSTFERMFPNKLYKKLKIRRKCDAFCRACDYNI